ncbi:GNAT family N-acetyltransferase [uncultured Alistipes sp.]|jgi:ribosomal protein S18 acetylase RimI-like enzyme|uniref:GNAT family N-acetyltransferase n=1 Tax=uncultured Alistipes sp. TaxID=538949 RepID=UPI0025E19BAB|nr:GNAT family N-acetyltransferase [uncultured Alistipes sp.]
MTHDLQLRPFRSPADEGWAEAMTIYREAFPRRERRDDATQAAALADPAFRAEGIWLNDKIAGLVFYWEHPEFHYIEHLALSPAMRARNIGSEVLETFCRNRRVILEIEPPEDTLTVRRLRFYERAGFVANPHSYIHPSYGEPAEPHRLVLMSSPKALGDDEVRVFADFVRERVMGYSQLKTPPTQPRLRQAKAPK